MTLKRHRAPLKGGYRRTTVTIPEELAKRVDAQVKAKPGMTVSAYVSDILETAVPPKAEKA